MLAAEMFLRHFEKPSLKDIFIHLCVKREHVI